VNVEQARAILAQGKKDGTYESPVPEDDGKAISEAAALVEMAQTAWDQHVRGPEVEALLRLADEDFNGNGSEPKEEPKAEEPTPEPDPEPDPEPEPAPDPTPEPESSGDEEDLRNVEPWEDYDKDKVSEIKQGIDAAIKDYSEQDLAALLGNIWLYESAHKNRETILKYLEKIAARMANGENPAGDDLPPEPAPEPAEDVEPAPEPEPEDEAVPEEGTDDTQQAENAPEVESTDPETEGTDDTAEEIKEKPREQEDADLSSDYENLVQHVNDELKRDRIHIPSAPEVELPELPWDWTKMSDGDLQKFHGAYSAAAYYKAYQFAKDERMATHCKQAADELHNALLVSIQKYDENGKDKRVALLEAEIESDENVKSWRRQQRKHEIYAQSHRNERDSISKLVEALSRHATLRHDEWERAGGKAGRGR